MKSNLTFHKYIKRVIIHPFLFCCLLSGYGQQQNVHELILNEQYGLAHQKAKALAQDSPTTHLLSAYNISLKLLLHENATQFKNAYNNNIHLLEKSCEGTSKALEDHYFSLSCIAILQGIVNYNYGEKLQAFFMLKKAKRLAERSIKEHPDYFENNLLYGLLNVCLGLIPDKYSWITNPLGFKGIFNDGLKALNLYQQGNGIFKKEATLSMRLINDFLFDGHIAFQFTGQVTTVTEKLMIASLNIKAHQAEKAVPLLLNTSTTSPIKELLLAEAYQNIGTFDKAYIHSQLFIEKTMGANYLKAAWKISYIATLLGNLNKNTDLFLSNIRDQGHAITSKDKEALSFSNSPEIDDPNMFEARMFMDGGNYALARKALGKCDNSLEKTYREARIYQLEGHHKQAITLYNSLLKNNKEEAYFIANSALQLGYIYYLKGNSQQAIAYFKKAIELPGYTYDETITLKAKLALEVFYGK